jgi:hypothetical protein
MSLINDALKRAKDAQQKSPGVAPGPQLRPSQTLPSPDRHLRRLLSLAIAFFVFLGLSFVWLNWQDIYRGKSSVAAIKPAVQPVPGTKPAVPAPAAPGSSAPMASHAPLKTAIAAAPAVPTPAPAPVMLKLQAIFFVPGRSSAIINGKTVQAGDTVQGFRVAAISRAGVTLVSATQTNVVTLNQ